MDATLERSVCYFINVFTLLYAIFVTVDRRQLGYELRFAPFGNSFGGNPSLIMNAVTLCAEEFDAMANNSNVGKVITKVKQWDRQLKFPVSVT